MATAFEVAVSGRRFRQPDYVVRLCSQCGLYFKTPTMPLDQLDSYYAALDSAAFEHDGDFPTDRVVQLALASLSRGSRVLDFGCSTGRLLKDSTARLECLGVEPNLPAAAAARHRGIRILSEDELFQGYGAGLDAIIMADVYEHLPAPIPLVKRLASLLKPGGWLAIVTGNADAIEDRDALAEFWYFRLPGHLQMASERHMTWLAGSLGLDLEALHRLSHYQTPFRERARQRLQAFAFRQFRHAPRSALTSVMRLVPRVRDAARWPTAPALMCGADHLVAVFKKKSSATLC